MSHPLREEKAVLRREALAARDALPLDRRIEKSLAACAYAGSMPSLDDNFLPGMIVSGFSPIRSEIDVRPLMSVLAERGARLCLPVVIGRTKIVFRELFRGAPLVHTGFGTSGPGEDAEELDPGLMLVPLSAFDRLGGRLGYGAGYYDSAIEKLATAGKRPLLVGMAFSDQEIDAVPMEEHDQRLDFIVTDEAVLEMGKAG